jgi:thymidylate synthase
VIQEAIQQAGKQATRGKRVYTYKWLNESANGKRIDQIDDL